MLGALLFAGVVEAAPDNLFEGYSYGDSRESFSDEKGYTDCQPPGVSAARCWSPLEFAGSPYQLALNFGAAGLTEVYLLGPFQVGRFQAAMRVLAKDFTLASIADRNTAMDVLGDSLSGELSSQRAQAVDLFEQHALETGQITYRLYDRVVVQPGTSNAQALTFLPVGLREVAVTIADDGSQNLLIIRFSMPRRR